MISNILLTWFFHFLLVQELHLVQVPQGHFDNEKHREFKMKFWRKMNCNLLAWISFINFAALPPEVFDNFSLLFYSFLLGGDRVTNVVVRNYSFSSLLVWVIWEWLAELWMLHGFVIIHWHVTCSVVFESCLLCS